MNFLRSVLLKSKDFHIKKTFGRVSLIRFYYYRPNNDLLYLYDIIIQVKHISVEVIFIRYSGFSIWYTSRTSPYTPEKYRELL